MNFNKIVKASDTLVFETPCTYCAKYTAVDTKKYGLPQTRNRVYMFVWQPEDGNALDNLVRLSMFLLIFLAFVNSPY